VPRRPQRPEYTTIGPRVRASKCAWQPRGAVQVRTCFWANPRLVTRRCGWRRRVLQLMVWAAAVSWRTAAEAALGGAAAARGETEEGLATWTVGTCKRARVFPASQPTPTMCSLTDCQSESAFSMPPRPGGHSTLVVSGLAVQRPRQRALSHSTRESIKSLTCVGPSQVTASTDTIRIIKITIIVRHRPQWSGHL